LFLFVHSGLECLECLEHVQLHVRSGATTQDAHLSKPVGVVTKWQLCWVKHGNQGLHWCPVSRYGRYYLSCIFMCLLSNVCSSLVLWNFSHLNYCVYVSHSNAIIHSSPIAVEFIFSCDKVHHKHALFIFTTTDFHLTL